MTDGIGLEKSLIQKQKRKRKKEKNNFGTDGN